MEINVAGEKLLLSAEKIHGAPLLCPLVAKE